MLLLSTAQGSFDDIKNCLNE